MNNLLVLRDLMVPMTDGVRLATDVFFPESPNNSPILIFRTPYSKDGMEVKWGFAAWFAAHGYIVIQQDCRGCYKSEGRTNFLEPEGLDGFDTLRWIESQEWGDADVGSWGTSWSGWTQTAMATVGRSRLKTIVPQMSGADAWSSSVRQGGALELRWMAWAFWHAAANTQKLLNKTPAIEEALLYPALKFQDWLRHWPILRGQTQLSPLPDYERWMFDLMEREDRSSFWDTCAYAPTRHTRALADISAFYIGSWYDSYARGTVELYQAHRAVGAARVHLMMGPWLHGTLTVEQQTAGGITLGPSAAIADYKTLLLNWFDCELKGHPVEPGESPIRLFVMGGGSGAFDEAGRLQHGGSWRDEQEWPLARTQLRNLYLHPDGSLRNVAPAVACPPLTFENNPSDPVPTVGGCVSSLSDLPQNVPAIADYYALPVEQRTADLVTPGGFDQRVTSDTFKLVDREGPLTSRSDVLVFETEPLFEPLEITGSVIVRLWVSTDAKDTDFTAKLIDVYPPSEVLPDGFALNLTDSILRLRYRDGAHSGHPVLPGALYPIEIILYPTSNRFVRGHRIRLDISSSNFPRFDVNPNTGWAPAKSDRSSTVARNSVHCDVNSPSCIILPIIP